MLTRVWRGAVGLKSTIQMNPEDRRLALIMAEYLGTDEEKTLRSPYRQLPVVYACIQAKARNIAKVPFVLHEEGSGDVIESGPLVDLFANPNKVTSRYELWQGIVISLDTGGEFFLYPEPKTDKDGIPTGLWVIPPTWVETWKTSGGAWLGWTMKRGKDRLNVAADEMIHGKYWNPEDELRGLAPIKSLALPSAIHWNALRYSRLFFENDATPSVVLESEKGLTLKQEKELQEKLYEKRRGVEKAHGFLILGGMTAKTIAPANKDIQLLEMLNASIDQVCMAFGVPKTELSLYGDVNRATAFTQDRSFWTKTLVPLGTLIADEINRDFLKRFGVYGEFDWSKVDAIRYDLVDKVDAAVKLVSIGFTPNEVNDRLDLGFEDQPWRDEPIMGLPAPEEPEPEDKPTKTDEQATKALSDKALSDALLGAKWKKLDEEILPLMGKAAARVRAYFADVERRLRARYSKHLPMAATKAPAPAPPEDFEWVGEAFSDRRLERALGDIIDDAAKRGAESVKGDVGRQFKVPDALSASAVRRRVNKLSDLNATAMRIVKEALRSALAKTIEDGVSEQEAAQLILDAMRHSMTVNMHRAKTIARTETHGAYSDGRWDAMHVAGITRKRWISSRDDKVRDSHKKYEQMGAIGIDAEFAPGLKRPHDPDCDEAGDVINCRCKCVAAFDERKD